MVWHFSFQHETIHAMRHVPRGIRYALAYPPLGLWFPYPIYNRSHSKHHIDPRLTDAAPSPRERDVFHDTLLEACFRQKDAARAERLLAERLARRRDHFRLNRTVAA